MSKKVLCGRCAKLMEDAFKVKRIGGGSNEKVECEECGKKHYGGTYEVEPKKRGEA